MPSDNPRPIATPAAADWVDHSQLVDFYTQARCRPDDLYDSERRFLPWLARRATTVLDVGCAAGGFKAIWQHYTPYLVCPWQDVAALIMSLRPARVFGYGYQWQPAPTVVGVEGPICFATFVMERPPLGDDSGTTTVCVELPFPWPIFAADRVQVVDAERLKAWLAEDAS